MVGKSDESNSETYLFDKHIPSVQCNMQLTDLLEQTMA